jgi:hypothetical protein
MHRVKNAASAFVASPSLHSHSTRQPAAAQDHPSTWVLKMITRRGTSPNLDLVTLIGSKILHQRPHSGQICHRPKYPLCALSGCAPPPPPPRPPTGPDPRPNPKIRAAAPRSRPRADRIHSPRTRISVKYPNRSALLFCFSL